MYAEITKKLRTSTEAYRSLSLPEVGVLPILLGAIYLFMRKPKF